MDLYYTSTTYLHLNVAVFYMNMVLVFSALFLCIPEPEPLPDLLRKDSRPALLHGGPLSRGHEDLDGRDRHRGGGIHAVHELRDTHVAQRARSMSRSFRQGPSHHRLYRPSLFSSPQRTQRLLCHSSFLSHTLILLCRIFPLHLFYVILFGLKKGALGGHTHLTHTSVYKPNVHLSKTFKKPFYIAKWRSCSYCLLNLLYYLFPLFFFFFYI